MQGYGAQVLPFNLQIPGFRLHPLTGYTKRRRRFSGANLQQGLRWARLPYQRLQSRKFPRSHIKQPHSSRIKAANLAAWH